MSTPRAVRRPLAQRIGLLGLGLLLLSLVSIGLTLWVSWQLEGGAAAVNEAGRLRMQTWRLAQRMSFASPAELQQQRLGIDATLALLQRGDPARPLFLPGQAAIHRQLDTVQQHWQQTYPRLLALGEPRRRAELVEALVRDIDALVSAIENRLSVWTTVLSLFQLTMMGLALAAGVAMLYASYLYVFNPLARLQSGLEQVEAGNLDAELPAETEDEFGALAAGFNRMARRLRELYQSLEAQVQERTLDLDAERQRLALLYEAASFANQAQSLEQLAQGFAARMRLAGGAQACLLRWVQQSKDPRALLLASDGVPEAMLDDERCLDHGVCHCGAAGDQQGPRVIPIHPSTQTKACERFGFSAVVVVPVRVHEGLIAEVDLLYTGPVQLDAEDRGLLDNLAAHLGGSMESLRVAALQREAAVAEERSLLARELHDSIAQSLAFLRIQAQLLREAQGRDAAAAVQQPLQELEAGLRECTADVRELLLHFRTRTNQEDIVPALRTTLQKFEKQSGLSAHLSIEGDGLPLDPDVQVQVLHVVQEALSNVRKHARARQVWLEVSQDPQWRFEVRDDGEGFASLPGSEDSQVGLRIMRERAARIGAAVAVDSVPGQGTCVVLTLPRAEAQAA